MTRQMDAKIDSDKEGGIRCPLCNFATGVKDSRDGTNNSTRRRRMCMSSKCGFRFTTFEMIAESKPRLKPEEIRTLVGRVELGIVFLQEKVTDLAKAADAARDIEALTRVPRE